MEEDENYIRRTTYGTPENIRIRRFYNRLNNRPINYGMEDLFPNVENYTAQPMTAVNNVDWSAPINQTNTDTTWNNPFYQGMSAVNQVGGALYDMTKNYFNMKKDKTINGDDYFHCLANYEAASRGPLGAKTAQAVGDYKELFDYYYNQYKKGLSQPAAYRDYVHDRLINQIGRQQAKMGIYSNSRDGCNLFRVNGINEKY